MVVFNKANPRTTEEDQEQQRVKKVIADQRSKQDAFAPRDLTLLYFSNWYGGLTLKLPVYFWNKYYDYNTTCVHSYFSSELTRVPVLKDFRFLRRLWINNNRVC